MGKRKRICEMVYRCTIPKTKKIELLPFQSKEEKNNLKWERLKRELKELNKTKAII